MLADEIGFSIPARTRIAIVVGIGLVLIARSVCADQPGAPPEKGWWARIEEKDSVRTARAAKAAETRAKWIKDIWERDTLTGNWFGLGARLEKYGITAGFSLTQVYQLNLKSAGRGTTFTHRRRGRWPGSWDLEVTADLEKLGKVDGAILYTHAEGSWSEGLDDSSVGSLTGINGDAAGYESIMLSELYWQQSFLEDRVIFRIGKLDITGGFECSGCPVAFDGNAYANDETTQFLNASLVNNPTIPFPDLGLAIVGYFSPVDWWYFGAGIADAQAEANETGFNTAFGQEDWFFSICETGVVPKVPTPKGPLVGAYRAGFWFDPQEKDNLLLRPDNRPVDSTSHDCGFYISADQMILKQNNDPDDDQGFGLFGRYGLADSRYNEISTFWSAGGQYKGLMPRRSKDVLGLGVSQAVVSRDAGHTAYGESVIETYYNCQITPWLHLTPSLQYVWYPGAERTNKDAVIISLRLQMSF